MGASTTRTSRPTAAAMIARFAIAGSSRQCSSVMPKRESADHSGVLVTRGLVGRGTLTSFRGSLAEEALGAEDEDQDQDREHDRLCPVAPGRVPGKGVVEGLDHPD